MSIYCELSSNVSFKLLSNVGVVGAIQRGGQKISNTCKIISGVVWTEAVIIIVVSWFHNDWLSLIQNFKLVFFFPLHMEVGTLSPCSH